MPGEDSHPRCAKCGERIGVYEPTWLQQADGTLTSTSLLNLNDEFSTSREASRFFHLGCLAPDKIAQSNAT